MKKLLPLMILFFVASCGEMQSSSFVAMNGAVSGSLGNTKAKACTEKLVEKCKEHFLKDYDVSITLKEEAKLYTFEFDDLKAAADLKALLEKELQVKVTLDDAAKKMSIE